MTADETKSPLEDNTALQDELDRLNAQITKQGAHVRQLKKDGVADAIGDAVAKLQALKIQATALTGKLEAGTPQFNRKSFDDLVLRKMFVVPSFEIHGGVKGLFDLGPPACALKVRLLIMSELSFEFKAPSWVYTYSHFRHHLPIVLTFPCII